MSNVEAFQYQLQNFQIYKYSYVTAIQLDIYLSVIIYIKYVK